MNNLKSWEIRLPWIYFLHVAKLHANLHIFLVNMRLFPLGLFLHIVYPTGKGGWIYVNVSPWCQLDNPMRWLKPIISPQKLIIIYNAPLLFVLNKFCHNKFPSNVTRMLYRFDQKDGASIDFLLLHLPIHIGDLNQSITKKVS